MTPGRLGSVDRSWLKFIHLSLMFMVLCCASVLCWAQSDRGSVSGTVTDPSGAGIVGAKVTITSATMGTQYSTVTTGVGDYTVPQLAAGQYSVTVGAPGFTNLVRNGITVSVGQVARVDMRLGVGQGAATVTVTDVVQARTAAQALCALRPEPGGVLACPADLGISYRLDFATSKRSLPAVTIRAGGCEGISGAGLTRSSMRTPAFWAVLGRAMGLAHPSHAAFAGSMQS